jgi:hypothetical protein
MHPTRQFVASLEDSDVIFSQTLDSGENLDETRADGDSPVIDIHGIDGKDPLIDEIKKGLEPNVVDAMRVVSGQVSYESQQQDGDTQRENEERAQQQAELQQGEDDLTADDAIRTDRKKVYILRGADASDDIDKGIHATFTALAQSAIEDPTSTVAAFIPVDATAGDSPLATPLQTREEEAMKEVLREKGVPFVTSVESLVEHLNYWANGKQNLSLESLPTKLRPGMTVKYSGGEGKIIKIFDRPTKYNGEIHHCTKDKPKYEVKALKGGKTSLHHGSALRPV